MHLEGSCHCQAIHFSLESAHPYPFNVCYCSICRKTTGGGGFAINLGGDSESLAVSGEKHLRSYQAKIKLSEEQTPERSPAKRYFCGLCGTHLWLWDPRWPELIHPLACVIDTPLPVPPEKTHLMLDSKAAWVEIAAGPSDLHFAAYPDESIADWHERLGLTQ